MAEVSVDHGAALARHAGDTIAAGGKRLRPLLVCLAAGVPPRSRTVSCMLRSRLSWSMGRRLSMTTCSTLRCSVVVDLRSWPAPGGAWPRRPGDLLFSRAFAELSLARSLPSIRVLSRASSELALGELMQRADAWRGDVTLERYLERCRLKTAVLFRAACELGAIEGEGPIDALGTLVSRSASPFSSSMTSWMSQGPPERTGKPQGADLLDGTITLPLIEARDRDPELAALQVRDLHTTADAKRVCERIAATGALETARARALELVRTRQIDPARLAEPPARRARSGRRRSGRAVR